MKILRSRKALSPVVASIILIAVTVAVSIAVAAWMGALTFNFMATEQGQVTNLTFTVGDATSGKIMVTFNNTGTNAITINELWVNNAKVTTGISPALGTSTLANSGTQYTVTIAVVAGSQYEVKLVSSKGNAFPRSGTAPT
ncbi:MAG: archaellin/type IV pilin N-terminal domain-containing protein [Candidatus Bathyarchaeia archaeon]|jgi:flagellin-like protein